MKNDNVNSPRHYTHNSKGKPVIQPIDFIESHELDFRAANVIKYVVRAPLKGNKLEDLQKAKFYLERLIKDAEEELQTFKLTFDGFEMNKTLPQKEQYTIGDPPADIGQFKLTWQQHSHGNEKLWKEQKGSFGANISTNPNLGYKQEKRITISEDCGINPPEITLSKYPYSDLED